LGPRCRDLTDGDFHLRAALFFSVMHDWQKSGLQAQSRRERRDWCDTNTVVIADASDVLKERQRTAT
jgi:hypothetical protein